MATFWRFTLLMSFSHMFSLFLYSSAVVTHDLEKKAGESAQGNITSCSLSHEALSMRQFTSVPDIYSVWFRHESAQSDIICAFCYGAGRIRPFNA